LFGTSPSRAMISESFAFERDRSVIQRHIRSIYGSKELDEKRTCAKNAQIAPNGKTYSVPFYNLDAVLPAGERIGNNLRTSLKESYFIVFGGKEDSFILS
jgi:hypothetical protein